MGQWSIDQCSDWPSDHRQSLLPHDAGGRCPCLNQGRRDDAFPLAAVGPITALHGAPLLAEGQQRLADRRGRSGRSQCNTSSWGAPPSHGTDELGKIKTSSSTTRHGPSISSSAVSSRATWCPRPISVEGRGRVLIPSPARTWTWPRHCRPGSPVMRGSQPLEHFYRARAESRPAWSGQRAATGRSRCGPRVAKRLRVLDRRASFAAHLPGPAHRQAPAYAPENERIQRLAGSHARWAAPLRCRSCGRAEVQGRCPGSDDTSSTSTPSSATRARWSTSSPASRSPA